MSAFITSTTRHLYLRKQRGAVLMIMLVILIIGATALLVSSLNSTTLRIERDKNTTDTLARAKEALIGDAVSQSPLTSSGRFSLPDLGFKAGLLPSEGSTAPSFSGNAADFSVIGKVPWKTLGISPSHDGQGECPWYIVSGRFKNNPPTSSPLNWDTLGQIDLLNETGNIIASNIAALLVAPGKPLDGQNRALSDPIYTECGGNYDAKNYLDSYNNTDAIAGQVNYFTGSTNNRVALNTNNKQFVIANNNHYNDQFLLITTDDIFRPIIHRTDFSQQISTMMNDLQSAGATSINCALTTNQTFCNNWKEMLFITQLPMMPTPNIKIDTVTYTSCSHVLIFSGQKTATQVRLTALDKANPANYLEGQNLAAYAIPTALSSTFIGASTFNPNSPSTDLLRCIP